MTAGGDRAVWSPEDGAAEFERAERSAQIREELQAMGVQGILLETLVEGMQLKKRVRIFGFECERCGVSCPHAVYGEVMDAAGSAQFAKMVLEQTAGRPGVQDGGSSGVTVVRHVVGLDD